MPQHGSIASGHARTNQKDAQQDVKDLVQKRSEILKNATDAIQELRKNAGNGENPHPLQAMGAQNLSALMSQVNQLFQQDQANTANLECSFLLATPNTQLNEEQLARKWDCELIANNAGANTANDGVVIPTTPVDEINNPQSALNTTLNEFYYAINARASVINAQLQGNVVISNGSLTITATANIILHLPTTDPHVNGQLWKATDVTLGHSYIAISNGEGGSFG